MRTVTLLSISCLLLGVAVVHQWWIIWRLFKRIDNQERRIAELKSLGDMDVAIQEYQEDMAKRFPPR